MLEITILASGSAGNSALVQCGETSILIDAGLSAKQLCSRLAACGADLARIDAIVLTHEHSDHTSSLRVLCAKRDIPIYATRMTAAALDAAWSPGCRNWRFFASSARFELGALTIESFNVPHDAVDPVGFLVRNSDTAFGLLTDLGHAPQMIIERMREADALFIETNYDDDLLQRDARRPWSLKQRISSRHGHLSNREAADVVAALENGRLRRVFLGHLSRDCNTPDLAIGAVRASLLRTGREHVPIHCAAQDAVSPRFAL